MPQPTTDTRAVVRAIDALTTQVGRVADAMTTPVTVDALATDDATTTGDDGCGTPGHGPHRGFTCGEVHQTRPYWNVQWEQEQQAPAADEDAHRTARRDSIRNLLYRIDRYVAWTPDETALLQRHVEAEIRESETARAVAAGNVRHVQQLVPEIDRLTTELERADAVTAETKKLMERRTTTLRHRAKTAEAELRALRSGIRAAGGDPTTIQNLWAQISLRNRQWREAKQARNRAQAANEGVRDAAHLNRLGLLSAAELHAVIGPVAAPDATEQLPDVPPPCKPGPYDDCPTCPHETEQQASAPGQVDEHALASTDPSTTEA